MNIIQADLSHLDVLTDLFEAYRDFYKQEANSEGARAFLKHNLENNECVIYLAQEGGKDLGFVQLYPTWESVTLSKKWVLYDLFVTPDGRGKGVGRQLMQRSKQLAQESGAKFIYLETATDNHIGQALYESEGYQVDKEFLTYILEL